MSFRIDRYATAFLLIFALGACQSTMAPPQKSLYDRLGQPAITACRYFVANVAADGFDQRSSRGPTFHG